MAFGPLGGFLGSIGGSLISTVGGLLGNRSQTKAAREQMDFQREMSGTAHQREVEDLRKAGLNPILSATGGSGASTPSGALAQTHNPLEGAGQGLQSGAQMLFKKNLQEAQAELVKNEAELTGQKKKESEALESKYKWDSEEANSRIMLNRLNENVQRATAKNLEADFLKKSTVGEAYKTAGDLGAYGRKLLEDASTLEPGHVLRGGWETMKEYFGKAKDWADNLNRGSHRTPSENFNKGKGNVYGGQHKADQFSPKKVPWSEVEKWKGAEDNPWHKKSWEGRTNPGR